MDAELALAKTGMDVLCRSCDHDREAREAELSVTAIESVLSKQAPRALGATGRAHQHSPFLSSHLHSAALLASAP